MKEIRIHKDVPGDFQFEKYDRSFIIVLDRMKDQALSKIRKHDPSVDSQTLDGELRGYYYAIEDVIKAFRNYG